MPQSFPRSGNQTTIDLALPHPAARRPRRPESGQGAEFSIKHLIDVSKKAIYYIMSVLPAYMIGLTAAEWDMILGGLEAFRENEEDWINDDRESVRQGAEKTIEKLDELYKKVNVIQKTMTYFEELLVK